MFDESFIQEIKNICLGKARITISRNNSFININKKNTFKVEMCSYDSLDHESLVGHFKKRTKCGGYKKDLCFYTKYEFLEALKKYIDKPEVEKTENKFDREKLIQNMLGREIMSHLLEIDPKSKMNRLANDEAEECKITSWTFRICRIYKDFVAIEWKMPCSASRGVCIKFDVSNPSFDPDLLVESIMSFAKKLKRISSEINDAWEEANKIWEDGNV